MKTINDGGPAFPRKRSIHGRQHEGNEEFYIHDEPQDGMSLRDWFAGMALQGILSNPRLDGDFTINGKSMAVDTASYQFADAMIAERNKP